MSTGVMRVLGRPLAWLGRAASPEVKARQREAEQAAARRFPNAPDKVAHASTTALVAGVVTELTGEPMTGLAAALGLGLAKELADGTPLNPTGRRELSLRDGDMAANYLGASIGAGLAARPRPAAGGLTEDRFDP